MDLALTEEQEMITGMVRRFVREEILPLELNLDPDADELPEADRQRLTEQTRAMGLYGLDIPPEFGGPEIDLITRTLIAIEASQHRAGLYAPCYGVFGGAGLAQLFEATEGQQERYLHPMLSGEKSGFFGLTEPSGGKRSGPSDPNPGGARRGRLDHQRRQNLHQWRGSGGFRAGLRPQPTRTRAATG